MGLLDMLPRFRAESSPPDGFSDYWYQPVGTMSAAGIRVSEPMAMKLSAVFAGRRAIAQPLGMLPLVVKERRPDGTTEDAVNHPLYTILHDAPNPEMTAMEFREALTGHAVMRGTGYALITPDYARGLPVKRLDMLHPDQVTPETLPSGVTRYNVRDERTGQEKRRLFDEMFKLRFQCLDGVTGVSVLTYARESIGLGLAHQQYASRFFKNSARPSGVIESAVMDVEARRRALAAYNEKYAGVENSHKTAILPPGFNWKSTGLTMEDAQFVESMTFELDEWARWFGVPPHMISNLARSTFSNIEEQAIEYVTYSLMPWGQRWEQSVKRDLLLEEERGRIYPKYNFDALLRGRTIDRYTAHGMAIRDGWANRNEVRELEDRDAVDGLDDFLIPLNMVEQSQLGQAAQELGQQVEVSKAVAGVFALDAAANLVRIEINAVSKAAINHADDGAAWAAFLEDFYAEHAVKIERRLHVTTQAAVGVCERHRAALLRSGVECMERWEIEDVTALAALAVADGTAPLELPAPPPAPKTITKRVERDDHGRIVSVTETANA